MKLDDYRTSDNVRDAGSGGGGFGGGGGMGGGLGMIIGLVASRVGSGGVVVVLLGAWMLGMFGGGGSGVVSPGGSGGTQTSATATTNAAQACNSDPQKKFSCQVLASTEDTWGQIFQASGQRYQPAGFDFYTNSGRSGCGAAQSAMGPFYCTSDKKIYVDTSFYGELQNRFGAAGDFAQAYVIAHEVGHHVQTITGVSDKVRSIQASGDKATGNRAQVAMELQADCYAGVWAAKNRDRLEPGDVEEGLRAAQAIGDDTLQRSAGQRPVPESFTHGTSAQRQQWLRTGLTTGDPAQCDTFGNRFG